jgi:hypothetical protein
MHTWNNATRKLSHVTVIATLTIGVSMPSQLMDTQTWRLGVLSSLRSKRHTYAIDCIDGMRRIR